MILDITVLEQTADGKLFVDVLVPENAGTGLTKWHYQRRTLIQYAGLFATGLAAFYKAESPALRAAGLGCLFPGAGLVAVFTLPSMIAFIVAMPLIPLSIFIWFGEPLVDQLPVLDYLTDISYRYGRSCCSHRSVDWDIVVGGRPRP